MSFRAHLLSCVTLLAASASWSAEVLTGIDVLRAEDFARLNGSRVGVITNHTGLACDGASTVDLLHHAPEVELIRIFSPEHGFRGTAEHDGIGDSKDPATGKEIVSLYGETRKPLPEHLVGLDALVFDIQDIGCRFYTYISTMGLAMEAAAEAGVEMVILDRPNPIGGIAVYGGLPDNQGSFTCFHDIPIVHGMTVGELALLFKKERKELDSLKLRVVEVTGWERGLYYDNTQIPWVAPSPNMPNLEAAFLYPGIGLLEFMNLSVGRGTDAPFRLIGAPFLDGEKLAAQLSALEMPGVSFAPATFTPTKSVFEGELCSGVRIRIEDRETCRPLRLGFEVAALLATQDQEQLQFPKLRKLLVDEKAFSLIQSGASAEEAMRHWHDGLESFLERRKKCCFTEARRR